MQQKPPQNGDLHMGWSSDPFLRQNLGPAPRGIFRTARYGDHPVETAHISARTVISEIRAVFASA